MKNKPLFSFALFLACFMGVLAYGQTQTFPFQNSSVQFFNNSGAPCNGCLLSTFSAGTTSPLATYSESTGTTPNANPVVLDSNGRAVIYLSVSSYKFVLKTAQGATLFTQDNVSAANLASTLTSLALTGNGTINSPTAATNSANQSGPTFCMNGNFWTGTASAVDSWCWNNVLGSGTNPTSTLTLAHSGSSGVNSLSLGSIPINSYGLTASSPLLYRDCRQDALISSLFVNQSAQLQACIHNGYDLNQQNTLIVPAGQFLLSTGIDVTNRPGIRIIGAGFQDHGASQFAPLKSAGITDYLCNTGSVVCFDYTGTAYLEMARFGMILSGATPSTIGILQGRDAAGSPSLFACNTQGFNIHDFAIYDNGANTTAFGGRGAIGVYNLGAEGGHYKNGFVQTETPFVLTDSNVASVTSSYQTIVANGGACGQVTMTNVHFDNVNTTVGPANTLTPNFEADGTEGIFMDDAEFRGGVAAIQFEGDRANVWHVQGSQEASASRTPTYFIQTSRPILDSIFHVEGSPVTAFINATANGLTHRSNYFYFNTDNTIPFATNTATGQSFTGGEMVVPGTTSASNITVTGALVKAPNVASSSVTFASGSKYAIQDNTGATNFVGGFSVGSSTLITQITKYSVSLTPVSVGAASVAEQAFTVTGVTTADNCTFNPTANAATQAVPVNVHVSAADTVRIDFVNPTAGALVPTPGTYTFTCFRN